MKRIWQIAIVALALSVVGFAQSGRSPALHITNGPVVEKTGDTTAVIAWTTNTGGSSIVRYGTDPNNLNERAQAPYADNSAGHETHRVDLKNLKPGATYYFMVDSGQGEGTGTEIKSAVAQFRTQGGRSPALQITNGPVVEKTGDTTAVIAWTTNTGGSSIVRYGTDPNNLNERAQSAYANNSAGHETHRVELKNLRPRTTYYFMVDSGQGEGTGTEIRSAVAQFATQPRERSESERITNGPVVEGVGTSWATIAWTTNTGGSSVIHYGRDANNLDQVAQSPYANRGEGHETHRVQVKNLRPSTTYFFSVYSGQGEGTGTEAKSSVAQFTTRRQ